MAAKPKQTAPAKPSAVIERPSASPDGSVQGEDFAYDLDPNRGASPLPTIDPDAPYFLAYCPTRWTVHDGVVMPLLARVPLVPGSNGIGGSQLAGAAPALNGLAKLTARMQAKGYTLIPHRLGPDGGSYIKRVPVRGGYCHLSAFATAYSNSARIDVDIKAMAAWVQSLIDAGHLEAPKPHTLRSLHDRVRDDLNAAKSGANRSAARAEDAERLARDLAAIKAKLADVEQAAEAYRGGDTFDPLA